MYYYGYTVEPGLVFLPDSCFHYDSVARVAGKVPKHRRKADVGQLAENHAEIQNLLTSDR